MNIQHHQDQNGYEWQTFDSTTQFKRSQLMEPMNFECLGVGIILHRYWKLGLIFITILFTQMAIITSSFAFCVFLLLYRHVSKKDQYPKDVNVTLHFLSRKEWV